MTNIMYKSHCVYLQEKYRSILLELKNIHEILNYYEVKTQKAEILEDLYRDIKHIANYLKSSYRHTKYGIKNIKDCNELEFLIYIDVHQKKLKEALEYLEATHRKVLQYLSENHVQALPVPSLQKRYSGKVLSVLMDQHTQALSNTLTDKDQRVNVLSSWSHNETYKLTRSLSSESSVLGNHSFYYHDLIWSLPTIVDHEVILASIERNSKFSNLIEDKARTISSAYMEYLDNKIDQETIFESKMALEQYRYFGEQSHIESFLYELVAGYVGFSYYGNSYKYAFYHENLGAYFGRDFWSDTEDGYALDLTYTPHIKRDFLLARLMLSSYWGQSNTEILFESAYGSSKYLEEIEACIGGIIGKVEKDKVQEYNAIVKCLAKTVDDEEKFNKKFHDIKVLIGKMIDTKKSPEIMLEYYKDLLFPGGAIAVVEPHINFENAKIFASFLMYQELIGEFILTVVETVEDSFLYLINNNDFKDKVNEFADKSHFFQKSNSTFTPISHKIWNQRFKSLKEDKLDHRSLLRREILDLDSKLELVPYVMEEQRIVPKEISSDTEEITLGYFDRINFEKKNTTEILDKFEEGIDTLFESLEDIDEDSFKVKHALLKIGEDINGSEHDNQNATLKLVLQIYTDDPSDRDNMKNIRDHVLTLDNYFKEAKVFKSLGSEDYICVFNIVEQRSAWDIVESIEKKDNVDDTYMTLVLLKQNNKFKLDNDIWIKQLYRLRDGMPYDNFFDTVKKIDENAEHMENNRLQVYDIGGVYDYELWWNVDSFEAIKETYNTFVEKNYISEVESFLVLDTEGI